METAAWLRDELVDFEMPDDEAKKGHEKKGRANDENCQQNAKPAKLEQKGLEEEEEEEEQHSWRKED